MSITPARKPRLAPAAPLFEGQSASGRYCESTDDFVDDLGAILADLAPGLGEEVIADLKAQVRDRWGGDRPFIARRQGEGRSERNAAIKADFQRGERVSLLSRRYGLTRMQIYRIVGVAVE